MKNKLFQKFYAVNVITVLVTLIMMMIMLSVSVGNYLTKEKRTVLTEYCKTVITGLSNVDITGKMALHNLMLTGKVIDAEVFLADAEGQVLFCNCLEYQQNGTCRHAAEILPASSLAAAAEGQFYEVGNFGGMFDSTYHTVGYPIVSASGTVSGFLFASSPASLLEDWLKNFFRLFLLCALLPLVLCSVVAYVVTNHMLKPLRMMSEAAHALAAGDFSHRIYYDGDDEIAELSKSFNTMTDSLVQLEGMRRSFVTNVSHELRTPMTTIGGFIDGILDGTIDAEHRDHYLRIVSSEVKRLTGIVQTMLSLSRLESGKQEITLTEIDLLGLICASLNSLEQRIEMKRICIRGLDTLEGVTLIADYDLFGQVIYNLVDNAVKFTPEEGEIGFSFEQTENTQRFRIRNSGQGIAKEDLPRVFERFYKADRSRSANKESSGLGLYIVKSIIDLHRGTITVRSVWGNYTEFEIDLPVEKEKDETHE